MILTIKNQEHYSRGELLLRTIFGPLYITLPHVFLLFFVGLWGAILFFVAFLVVVFTGNYPQSFFEFQVQLMRWKLRLNARLFNLSDGYPAFGLLGTDDEYTQFEVPYPEGSTTVSEFESLTQASFPYAYMDVNMFFDLRGNSPPRIYYLREGKAEVIWDKDLVLKFQETFELK